MYIKENLEKRKFNKNDKKLCEFNKDWNIVVSNPVFGEKKLEQIIKNKIYFLSGPVGVGKTTISNYFKNTCNCEIVEEFDLSNPLIKDIITKTYSDNTIDKKVIQNYTFANRLLHFELAYKKWKKQTPLLVDRGPFDPLIFSKLQNVQIKEHVTFLKNYFKNIDADFEIIVFDLDYDTNIERIIKRNRANEKITPFTIKMIKEWKNTIISIVEELDLKNHLKIFKINKDNNILETLYEFLIIVEK